MDCAGTYFSSSDEKNQNLLRSLAGSGWLILFCEKIDYNKLDEKWFDLLDVLLS